MKEQTKGTGAIDQSVVEDGDGILTIRGGGPGRGWNGIQYQQGMSGKKFIAHYLLQITICRSGGGPHIYTF